MPWIGEGEKIFEKEKGEAKTQESPKGEAQFSQETTEERRISGFLGQSSAGNH